MPTTSRHAPPVQLIRPGNWRRRRQPPPAFLRGRAGGNAPGLGAAGRRPGAANPFRMPLLGLFLVAWALGLPTPAAFGQTVLSNVDRMKRMSLEELLSLEVSTISRKEERWWSAPGAIEVVTDEEIRRSGALNLPEALRLATGLDVQQPSARSWAVSARGFNVLAANKISVLLDGRSLFTPFFSGVQWDAQDTMLEDIDRIEVVRGPVGALWGTFAVNGFVQIVTKPADATQGWLATAGTGTEDPGFVAARYGGRVGRRTFYRVYAKYSETDWTYLENGRHAQPSTDFFQTGFRVDAFVDPDTVLTVQGDAYTNRGLPRDREQTEVSGGNVLARVQRSLGRGAELDVLSYYDRTFRWIPAAWQERRDSGAINAKLRLPGERHDLLLGADVSVSSDRIARLGAAQLEPPRRTVHTAGAYVQDTIALVPRRLALTLAAKGEHNSFSGLEFQPSIRGAWTPSKLTTVWAGISRAVRAPVRVDHDLVLRTPDVLFFEATDAFQSETVVAYELGWRRQIAPHVTVDVATFHNDYRHLRTTEPVGSQPLPLTFKNGFEAGSNGVETAVMFQPDPRLFFKLSYRYLDLRFDRVPGSRAGPGTGTEANDPRHLGRISVHALLPWNLEFDAGLRYTGDRPDPATDSYLVGDVRLGWTPSERWDVSLIGRNLFSGLHREFVTTNSLNEFIRASGTVKVTCRY